MTPLIHFEYPYLLLLIPPVIYALKKMMKHTGYKHKLHLLSRTLIASLIITALASPITFTEQRVSVETPGLLIISDNTPSMEIFDHTPANELYSYFKKKSIINLIHVNTTNSPLGDTIIKNIQPQQSILLISDGQNNKGSSLEDAIALANSLNSTVYSLTPTPAKKDISVHIEGPSKTITGQDTTFLLRLNTLNDATGKLSVWLDRKSTTPTQLNPTTFQLTTSFKQTGSHTLRAQITPTSEDFYQQNNIFYKTIYVVPKPTILLVTKETSPLQRVLEKLYTLTTTTSLPTENLNTYSTIVLDNIPSTEITSTQTSALSKYTAEGGGLVITGGLNSYDYGGYEQATGFTTLLPVTIGGGAPESKNTGIIILLDISGSTGHQTKGDSKISIEKALAIQLLTDISFKDYIGLISFYNQADTIIAFERGARQNTSISRVSRLTHGGTTSLLPAIHEAEDTLENFRGTSNIIIISDGKLTDKTEEKSVINQVENLFKQKGITTYTIGVGEDTNEKFMKQIAKAGRGLYLKKEEASSIKLLFADKTGKEQEQQDFLLTPLTTSHFITANLQLQNATITGYNNAAPKSNSQTLIMTDNGKPIITTMRYGLGRIAALTTDNGNNWASKLYTQDNSQVITTTLNWAIENPERNQPIQIQAPDTYQDQPLKITIKTTPTTTTTTATMPQATLDNKPLQLSQKNEHQYTATTNTNTGFHTIQANNYQYTTAVNPPSEYHRIGYNTELNTIITNNGGKTYNNIEEAKNNLIHDLQGKQTRVERSKKNLNNTLITIALLLFTIEVIIRRASEIIRLRKQQK